MWNPRRIALAVLCAGVLVSGSSIIATGKPGKHVVAPAPAGRQTRPSARGWEKHSESLFTIWLPPGWSGGRIPSFGDDAARSFRYHDSAGNFFIVNVDPAGADFAADQVWRYAVSGSGFVVKTVEPACRAGEAECGAGDGRLDVYALWTEGGSAALHGHGYYFHFGNDANETAETPAFRRILEHVRIR